MMSNYSILKYLLLLKRRWGRREVKGKKEEGERDGGGREKNKWKKGKGENPIYTVM